MPTGAQVQSKVSSLLARVGATPRTVKFRQFFRSGGNPRLGVGGVESFVDTLADPQPAVQLVAVEEIAGAGGLIQPGDWELVFSGSLPESILKTQQILFGDTELLNIVRYEPYALNGVMCAWRVIARTVQTQ